MISLLVDIATVIPIQGFVFLAASIVALLSVWTLLDSLGYQNPPPIKGMLDFPGYPIVGNVFQTVKSPALTYMKWSKQHNDSIFQVRLGNQRIVVVNSFKDVNKLWVGKATSTNSRPFLYTFHRIVSATQGFTIGSTPFCDSYKKKKKVISMHLNKRSVDEMSQIVDQESHYMIRNITNSNTELLGPPSCNMFQSFRYENSDIDLKQFAQFFALRSSVYISYGIHLDCYNRDRKFCEEIIEVESQIMRFRSVSSNLRDYLTFMRYIPWKSNSPDTFRQRRDLYMEELYRAMQLKQELDITRSKIPDIPSRLRLPDTNSEDYVGLISRIESHVPSNCSTSLSRLEIQSLCLTMVSAGLDNTPLTFNHLMGHFSQPNGDRLQTRAFFELMKLNNNSMITCWDTSSQNTDCAYVMALIHEALRYFSVLPLGLPRVTTKDIHYKDFMIPKGTTLIMNTFAANHDEEFFKNPYEFLPERWLNEEGKLVSKNVLNHLSFGAGSRMCSGNHLSLKELYTLTCRMILMYKVRPPTGNSLMLLDPFKSNLYEDGTSFEPVPFKVRLEPRIYNDSDKLYLKVMRS